MQVSFGTLCKRPPSCPAPKVPVSSGECVCPAGSVVTVDGDCGPPPPRACPGDKILLKGLCVCVEGLAEGPDDTCIMSKGECPHGQVLEHGECVYVY